MANPIHNAPLNSSVATLVTQAEKHMRNARAAWGDLEAVQREIRRALKAYALADLQRHYLVGHVIISGQAYAYIDQGS